MKKLREMKKNQKGFTLVEVIVVLVILAIMAAILIPSLIGYIDKARANTVQSECRAVVQAAQTLASEQYAKDRTITDMKVGTPGATNPETSGSTVTYTIKTEDVIALAEVEGTIDGEVTFVAPTNTTTKGKVSKLVYKLGNNTCTYENGKYTIS